MSGEGSSSRNVYFRKLLLIDFPEAYRLRKKYGSPLLVLSREKVKKSFLSLQEALPQVKIYYAIKANPHEEILKTLKEAGSGFEAASFGELKKLMAIDILPKETLNTQPFLSPEELHACHQAGQRWFVFDNEDQLKRLADESKDLNLLLRLSFPNPECQVDLSYKFGATVQEAPALLKKAAGIGVNIRGISFHVGSQSYTTKNYLKALKSVRKLIDAMQHEGIFLDIIDIGGGFPIPYLKYVRTIENFVLPIKKWIFQFFPGMQIWAEPGRFICGLAQNLITTVNGKNIRRGIPWYYLDDGIYNSFSGKVYDHCDYRILFDKKHKESLTRSVLAGPTCDSFDIIADDIMLPSLEIGEVLLVPSMGAYTNVSATWYNGFNPAKILTID